ncbi:hypothetical protein [Actibacterium mucosum]|uniref:hypothetical protein n=1 Tax=Actibacterium mucosum TaxID=1087332 RepID=UPI001F489722|nr:hypothetical protein [Actibacterium mucosum]
MTQLGGLAWLGALAFRRRFPAFAGLYAVVFLAAHLLAPTYGRVALPCFGDALRSQSPAYCLMMRNFVVPELRHVAQDTAQNANAAFPGTVTLTLDGGFPFWDEFPMLPHLSHDDGEKLDLAFYYQRDGEYLPGTTRSPIGFWAFELTGPDACPPAFPTMRWGMSWIQPLLRDLRFEPERTAHVIRVLSADPRVGKIFVEPELVTAMSVQHEKVRFQGCRAARHDDHIHFQLK